MSFTTYELEGSERKKESLTTYHLERSERLTGLGETTNSSEGRGQGGFVILQSRTKRVAKVVLLNFQPRAKREAKGLKQSERLSVE